MRPLSDRILLHIDDGLRELVDPADVFFLQGLADETRVRRRGARPLVDVRPLGELLELFEPHGFLRIHRSYAVNLRRIRQLRRRQRGRDWEVKLEPPVNLVLPVSREVMPALSEILEGGRG